MDGTYIFSDFHYFKFEKLKKMIKLIKSWEALADLVGRAPHKKEKKSYIDFQLYKVENRSGTFISTFLTSHSSL